MAKTQGLSLKDLLDKQRELAAQGNEAAQKQVQRLEALAESVREQTESVKQQQDTLQEVAKKQPKPQIAANLEKLAKQDRLLQVAQVVEAAKAVEDDHKIVSAVEKLEKETKKGLIDSSGTGLNANIIKLSKELRAALNKPTKPEGAESPRATPVNKRMTEAQRQDKAGQAIADSAYYKGSGFGEMFSKVKAGIGSTKKSMSALKETYQQKGFKQAARDVVSGARAGVSNLASNALESTFDLSEGRSEGFLGQVVRKKVAKNAYVRDEMRLNPVKNREAQRKMLNLRFEKNNQMVGKMRNVQDEIDLLRSRGGTDDEIAKTGLFQQRAAIEQTAMITDPRYREKARQEKESIAPEKKYVKPVASAPKEVTPPAPPVSSVAPTIKKYVKPAKTYPLLDKLMDRAGVNPPKSMIGNPLKEQKPDAAKTVVAQSVAGLIGAKPATPLSSTSSEAEQENLRLFTEQNETLKKIEENTRMGAAGKAAPVTGQPTAAAEGGGGGILSSVADFAKDKLLNKGGSLVGGVAKLAKGVGIGGIASLAGEGIQSGGDALKEAGYEQTGKAVNVAGTATKYAGYGAMIGSVIPGVGTAIGAGVGGVIGAGKGIYDQYFGADSKKGKAEPVAKAPATNVAKAPGSGSESKGDKLRTEATKLGIDPNKAEGTFEGGQLTKITDTTTGKTYPIAVDPSKQRSVDAAREMRAMNDRSAQLAKAAAAPTPQGADEVYQQSSDNATAKQQAPAAPVVVNAPSTTTVSQTTNNSQKSPPRNTESSWRDYNRAKYAF